MKDLMNSSIPQIYSNGLYREIGYDVPAEHTDKVLTTLVYGITDLLAAVKSTAEPISVVIKEANDEFIVAATVEYFENEDDPKAPGNWSYTWTFNKDDVPENARIISLYDGEYASYFKNVAASKFNMGFHKSEYLGDLGRYLMKIIKRWLIDNAGKSDDEGNPIDGVSLEGIIQFRTGVENDDVVLSAEPDGEIKQMIKSDSTIEK